MSDMERYQFICQMFEALEREGTNITEWEESFLKSIKQQFDDRKTLSPKQFQILERIYSERTP